MSLQLANMFLSLVFLCLRMGAAENAVPVFMVNVTPPSLTAMEGSEFTLECTFKTSNDSIKLFAEWYQIKNNGTEKVCKGADGIILSNKEKTSVSLTVKKADITDSGTYLCRVASKHGVHLQETSNVTVNEITDLMVNQTPASFSDFEGSEFTMACTFKTINDHSSMYVQWYNYGTGGLKSELVDNSNVITTRHLDKGFTSLTLKNANSSNTGTYVCEVGTTARNLSGNGTGTQVTIEKMPKLMVNQTPANIQTLEGSDLTLECRFPVWKKHNTLYVKWYKHNGNGRTKKELMREGGWGSAALDLEEGFASFTLKNVNVTDTGTYRCEVEIRSRNCSASGAGTQVTIAPVDLMVNQTPAFVTHEEGKPLTIECRFRALEKPSTKYSVQWYKREADGHEKELKNETGSVISLDFSRGLASLTVTKASVSDSGVYRCDFGKNGRGNGTIVTIHVVDLLVNQTPAVMNGPEGEQLTIECRFKVVKDSSTTYSVMWHKTEDDGEKRELKNGTGFLTTALDPSKGLASLTFIKISRNDSGLYRCDFGKNGVGNGTRVTVHEHNQTSYIVPGAVAGTLLFLLVLGMLLWRCKRCSKEPLQSRSEEEMNQMEPSSPSPADDVTYADLNFQKKNAKAEEEVVYTEVKIQPKQRDESDIYAKVKPRHR